MDTTELPGPGDRRAAFYVEVLDRLAAGNIPFLVGGSFAFARHTNRDRNTKDLDIFLLPQDVSRALCLFEQAGCKAQMMFPHWLAKVRRGQHFVDLIFSSGNGLARVDNEWFANSTEDEVLGKRVRLCPLEEMIWSKAFVQERERFDGTDVLHLFREGGLTMDWGRLLSRFGEHWPVLLGHIILFRYVYPDCRDRIPAAVVEELLRRLREQRNEPENRTCYGTLLSREQFLPDLERFGYVDGRLDLMSADEIRIWTDAIERPAV
ncbi:MAG TPA: hypothetical protein VJP86_15870 [Vicinamibacterales bacterium]|nr:hypothetical protein [Vicinamibacterales bacterium]